MPYKTKTVRVKQTLNGGYGLVEMEWTKAGNVKLRYFRPKKKRVKR